MSSEAVDRGDSLGRRRARLLLTLPLGMSAVLLVGCDSNVNLPVIDSAQTSPDGRTLSVHLTRNDCANTLKSSLTETEDRVRLRFGTTDTPHGACAGTGVEQTVTFLLETPLGKRPVEFWAPDGSYTPAPQPSTR